jgi:hypothetical protein
VGVSFLVVVDAFAGFSWVTSLPRAAGGRRAAVISGTWEIPYLKLIENARKVVEAPAARALRAGGRAAMARVGHNVVAAAVCPGVALRHDRRDPRMRSTPVASVTPVTQRNPGASELFLPRL